MKTDSEIQKDVMDELKWESFLDATNIGVAVKNGVVTLTGTVDSYLKKTTAEKAAKRIAGVKAVAEEIEVKNAGHFIKNDSEIAEAVLNALKWHSALQEDKLKVKVEKGVVTLEGLVDWEFQRNSARLMIENLRGVRGIINSIKIAPHIIVKDLKQKINDAFHRSATVDSGKISVKVDGDKVILTGKVRSLAEKEDAEKAVWAARGISEVEDKLEIENEIFVM